MVEGIYYDSALYQSLPSQCDVCCGPLAIPEGNVVNGQLISAEGVRRIHAEDCNG